MRVLFGFAGGAGHAEPLVPVARACHAAGHQVAFSGRASVVAALERRGFATFPDPVAPVDELTSIAPLVPPDPVHERAVLRTGFAGSGARARAERVLAVSAAWRPHVVVCDEIDYGGMIAAERLGVPHASVLVIAAGSLAGPEVVRDALGEVRAEHGLAPDPELEMLRRHLVLCPCPPSFRDPAVPLPATGRAIRPVPLGPAAQEPAPEWVAGAGPAPVVYFTLGTVFNVESGDLFPRVLAGLAELPATVVATVGPQLDPESFGPRPRHVRLERHVPQTALLPRCDVVVSHGGSGTVVGALAAGVPSVLLPMGADQPQNAERCQALGAGLVLDPLRATPAEVRDAVLTVLGDPSYRAAARRLQEEAMRLPDATHAVALLEGLAGRPVVLGA